MPDPLRTRRRLAVWPYAVLCALTGVSGACFVWFWWPGKHVDETALVHLEGAIETVRVQDDLSGTSAGALLPGMTSVYFTLEGVEGTFRYPFTHPYYPTVRDNTGVAIEIWVDPVELQAGDAATIWQIREHNPHDAPGEETDISYAEVVERLDGAGTAMVRLGGALLVACAVLLAISLGVRRLNTR